MDRKFLYFSMFLGLCLNLIACTPITNAKNTEENLQKAKEFLEKYILIDGHNDLPYVLRKNFQNQFKKFDLNDLTKYNLVRTHTDLKRLEEGRLGGQFWAVYADCSTQGKDAVRVFLEQIDVLKRLFKKYPNNFQFVKTAAEAREAFKNKKIASMFGLESGHAIDSSLSILRIFHRLGVRYMTLTHNCNTPWADNNKINSNNTAPRHSGLTDFGKTVIKEMNRIGMMVDLSHVAHETMIDALNTSKTPVIFSHSSVYSLCNHTRNVHDDVLDKLKENGGVVMINFYNGFITCNDSSSELDDVINHINYVKNRIGVEFVGIGADYDGVDGTPNGLEDVSKYPQLFAALIANGWSESDLIKLAGENILKVLENVEKYAEDHKKDLPSDEIIDSKFIDDAGFKDCRIEF